MIFWISIQEIDSSCVLTILMNLYNNEHNAVYKWVKTGEFEGVTPTPNCSEVHTLPQTFLGTCLSTGHNHLPSLKAVKVTQNEVHIYCITK